MALGGKYHAPLTVIENALAIVQLRLSDDEWVSNQGRLRVASASTPQLLAMIASQALDIHADLTREEGS